MIKKIINKNIKNAINNIRIFNSKKYINQIEKTSILLTNVIKSGNKIFFCGNGGSAADSQHLCGELVSKFLKKRKPYSAISLTTNTSTITSIANDFSYSEIFSKQIEALGKKGDALIAISTSGKSLNIKKAIVESKKMGMHIIFLTGVNHKLEKKYLKNVNISIAVPGKRVDRIQELHILTGHILCEIIENNLTK